MEEGLGYGSVPEVAEQTSQRRRKEILLFAIGALVVASVLALAMSGTPQSVLEETADSTTTADPSKFRADAKKALDLEVSKAKYDAAKDRVNKLHDEFVDLENKLNSEVSNLDEARGQLVTQIKSIEGNAVPNLETEDENLMQPLQKVVSAVASKLNPGQSAIVYDPAGSTVNAIVKNDAMIHNQVAAAAAKASATAADASKKASQDADDASKKSLSAAQASQAAAKAAIVHVVSAAVSAKASSDAAAAAKDALNTAADASKSALEAAKESRDAADASQASLTYAQGVASKVGSLVDESEAEAARIASAGKVTDEAKNAMQAALEQSSQIVDYNTHAAQAVAQDAGFVSAAAKTVSTFLESIFKDTRSVHKAAEKAKKNMKRTLAKIASQAQEYADAAKTSASEAEKEDSRARTAGTAADDALKSALKKADKADDVLERIQTAEAEVAKLASHAGLAARVASDAAAGAAQGEKMAMTAGYRARARVSNVYRAVPTGSWAARPGWVAGGPPGGLVTAPTVSAVKVGPSFPVAASAYAPPGSLPYPGSPYGYQQSAVRSAKELVDSVILLMRKLESSLDGALYLDQGKCRHVRELLVWYQAQMSQYHAQGLVLARTLSEEDMDLVEEYAESQVSSFSDQLEQIMAEAAEECGLSAESFAPELGQQALVAGPMDQAQPMFVQALPQEEPHDAMLAHAKERVQLLKAKLAKAEAVEKRAMPAENAASKQAKMIAQEQKEVAQLKEQVAALMSQKSKTKA